MHALQNRFSVLNLTVIQAKGWSFCSNSCVAVLSYMEEASSILQDAQLPSGAARLQFCEATVLQAIQCVALITENFDRAAVKFSMEKGTGGGVTGGLEVLKDIGSESTKALKDLVVGEDSVSASNLLGEINQEQQVGGGDDVEGWCCCCLSVVYVLLMPFKCNAT